MFWAGLLALPLVLASTSDVSAQGCGTGNCPPGFGWAGPVRSNPYGCGALCFRLFGALHQDGPLFNYGPYTGYYPFEPYGPWTADLRYNGPQNGACGHCGLFGRGCGPHGCGHLGGLFHRGHGSDNCGGYASSTWRNVFSRLHPFQRCASAGCSSAVGCGDYLSER